MIYLESPTYQNDWLNKNSVLWRMKLDINYQGIVKRYKILCNGQKWQIYIDQHGNITRHYLGKILSFGTVCILTFTWKKNPKLNLSMLR